MDKPQILLLTHGGWGMALADSLKMILGAIDFVHEIPLLPELTFLEYYEQVEEFAKTLPEHSLILTDVFGGTTTNVGAKIGRDKGLNVISGLNAPLLIEACSQIMFTGTCNFESVLKGGKNSVMDVVEEVRQSLEKKEKNNGRTCIMQN